MAEPTPQDVAARARDMYNKGFGAFERGKLDYAIDLLFQAVELDPNLLQARKFLRAAEIRQFKAKKGGALAGKLSSIQGMGGFLKASALARSDKPEKVLQGVMEAEKMLRKNPLNVRAVQTFTEVATAAGLVEAAVMTLEMAREHHPDEIYIINSLGLLYQQVGRMQDARQCFEKLCEMKPNDPAALKSLKDAMALDSLNQEGWSQIADGGSFRDGIRDAEEATLLEQQNKAKKSEQDIVDLIANAEKKIEEEPDNVNYYRALARLHTQSKSFDAAIEVLQRALEVSPGDPELDKMLSQTVVLRFDQEIAAYREAGDEEAADTRLHERDQYVFDDLQQRVARYPNDLEVKFLLGKMLYDNAYYNEAIQQFQAAQRSPQHRVQALYQLGLCFKQKKQYDMAIEQLETAMADLTQMDDAKKNVCYELGLMAEAMDDKERAAGYYKQIYQSDISFRDIADKIDKLYNG